jgi:hypothetical protein
MIYSVIVTAVAFLGIVVAVLQLPRYLGKAHAPREDRISCPRAAIIGGRIYFGRNPGIVLV